MADKLINVKITPKAKREEIFFEGDRIIAKVSEPPSEGKANERLIELLSEFLNYPKNKIIIVKGLKSRIKLVLIKE
ncbi:MAG: DUF167 domain-containing protein [Proteobacteria bacterium]|nr:DUF167 domain-containing protein [Pseudomonadota bacterium]